MMEDKIVTIPFPIETDTLAGIIQDFVDLNRRELVPNLTLVEVGRTTEHGSTISRIDGPINAILTIIEDDDAGKYRRIFFQIKEGTSA